MKNPECYYCEKEIIGSTYYRFNNHTYCSLECAAQDAGITEEWIEEEEDDSD